MSTHAFGRVSHAEVRVWHGLSVHWVWLAGGFVLAFAMPYVLADVLAINRDLFYGLYALAVIGLFASQSSGEGSCTASQTGCSYSCSRSPSSSRRSHVLDSTAV